mgnify:FL=1
MTEQSRCEDNIAFVNSFFQQFSEFRTKAEKDLEEKSKAIVALMGLLQNDKDALQRLMSEMIRLAKVIELERAAKLIVKPSDIQVKLQPDKNIWDWLKELRK